MKERFLYRQGLVIISAKVRTTTKRNIEIMLAIDTGSYISSINPEILEQVGAAITNESVLLLGIGEKISTRYALIKSLTFLNININSFKVAVHQLPENYSIDGILGNDVLQQYKLTIDYPNQTITLE